MLGTVFKVLGIIGIVLLVILAIAIALILFVVLAPLNYKFIFRHNGDEDQDNACFLKLNWLCHIVRCRIDIGLKGIEYELRLFGFKSRLLDKYFANGSDDEELEDIEDNGDNEDSNKDNKDVDNETYDDYEDLSACVPIDNSEHVDSSSIDQDEETKDDDLLDDIEEIWEDLISETEYQQEDTKKRFSWKKLFTTNPIKVFVKVIKNIVKHIKAMILAIIKTFKVLIRKYELVVELWEKKSTQVAIERILRYVSQLCKHIKPRKTRIKVDYGFDDPALTGQVLGGIGTIYGFVGEIIEVNPDFEESKLDINCYLSGRMRVLNLGIIVIKVMRDKAIKRLLSNIDKLKEELNNVR